MGPLETEAAQILEEFRMEGEDVIRISSGKSIMTNKAGPNGYQRARVTKRGGGAIGVHRIKFCPLHGFLPEEVDHRNRDRGDASGSNLRAATRLTNMWNTPRTKSKVGLPRGVNRQPSGRFQATVKHMGRGIHLGMYDTPEEASRAYQEFCHKTRGEFHDATL